MNLLPKNQELICIVGKSAVSVKWPETGYFNEIGQQNKICHFGGASRGP